MIRSRALIATVLAMAVLLVAPPAARAADIVVQVPGNTIVQDAADDLWLVNCNSAAPNSPCSLPPGASHDLPGWMDIKTAKIKEIGGGRVDFSIAMYEPIPTTPPNSVTYLSYYWAFEGGCALPGYVPNGEGKDGIVVEWKDGAWKAQWTVITSCDPRKGGRGHEVPFTFTDDGLRVRVSLDELLVTQEGATLSWYAGVRRMGFMHPFFKKTAPVDCAPDVCSPPKEDQASWDPRRPR